MSLASKLLEQVNSIQLDERIQLNEMATIIDKRDGLGIIVKIYSEDHPPAHMHVFDSSNNNLIARVIIPSSNPSSIKSIRPYGNESLTNSQKKVILKAMLLKDKELDAPIWKAARYAWNILHPDFPS